MATGPARAGWPSGFLLALAVGICGCASPPVDLPERPSTPVEWVTVATEDGRLSLDLPPWLVPFDRQGAIFANEVTAPGTGGMQLRTEGPVAEVPPAPGESLEDWLADRLASPVAGAAAVRRLATPIGEGIAIDRVDEAGTPRAWRIAAYAIRVSSGHVVVIVDGPVAAWTGREADIALVPLLVRVGPASAGLELDAVPGAGAPPVPATPDP